jgi:hypothetical protein
MLERGWDKLPYQSTTPRDRSTDHGKGVRQTTLPFQIFRSKFQRLWKGGGEDYQSNAGADPEMVGRGVTDYPAAPGADSEIVGRGETDYSTTPGVDPEIVGRSGADYPAILVGRGGADYSATTGVDPEIVERGGAD